MAELAGMHTRLLDERHSSQITHQQNLYSQSSILLLAFQTYCLLQGTLQNAIKAQDGPPD